MWLKAYRVVPSDGIDDSFDVHFTDAHGDHVLERGFSSETAAYSAIENVARSKTQFHSWSSDPNNDSYRELLITLPLGQGSNPERAPSTHWDQEGVVAHVRFMEKADAEGKRVLFIEEVQSDWHQKGRDQGYEQPVSEEQKAKIAEAAKRVREATEARSEAQAELRAEEHRLNDLAVTTLRKAYEIDVASVEETAKTNGDITPGAVDAYKAVMGRQYFIPFFEHYEERGDQRGYIGYHDLSGAIESAQATFERHNEPFPEELKNSLESARALAKERRNLDDQVELANRELFVAQDGAKKGIPDAPFKSSWPALVMKRAIRWAVDNGYDKVAWTTGEEQADRYNLATAVGDIFVRKGGQGASEYVVRLRDNGLERSLIEQGHAVATEDGLGMTAHRRRGHESLLRPQPRQHHQRHHQEVRGEGWARLRFSIAEIFKS
jgi:hypothetical protein